MTKVSEFGFNYYPDLKEPYQKYPDLKNDAFKMQLQTDDEFLIANVRYDFIFKDICIEFYNEQGELIQNRIRVSSGINLLYLLGYSLFWLEDENKFVFYKENTRDTTSTTE